MPAFRLTQLFEQACLGQAFHSVLEPRLHLGPARLRQRFDQFRDIPGFYIRNRHQLTTTRSTPFAARNLAPARLYFLHRRVHDRIREILSQWQQLRSRNRHLWHADLKPISQSGLASLMLAVTSLSVMVSNVLLSLMSSKFCF
jgi:hypothetical protein